MRPNEALPLPYHDWKEREKEGRDGKKDRERGMKGGKDGRRERGREGVGEGEREGRRERAWSCAHTHVTLSTVEVASEN